MILKKTLTEMLNTIFILQNKKVSCSLYGEFKKMFEMCTSNLNSKSEETNNFGGNNTYFRLWRGFFCF